MITLGTHDPHNNYLVTASLLHVQRDLADQDQGDAGLVLPE